LFADERVNNPLVPTRGSGDGHERKPERADRRATTGWTILGEAPDQYRPLGAASSPRAGHSTALLGSRPQPMAPSRRGAWRPQSTSGVRAPGLGRESAPSRLHVVYAPAHPILRQRLGQCPTAVGHSYGGGVALGYGRLLREYRMPRRSYVIARVEMERSEIGNTE